MKAPDQTLINTVLSTTAILHNTGRVFRKQEDPDNMGSTILGGFVVGLRCALISLAESAPDDILELPPIGSFKLQEGRMIFTPSSELQKDAAQESGGSLRLLDYFSAHPRRDLFDYDIIEREALGLVQYKKYSYAELFRWCPRPEGSRFLHAVFVLLVKARIAKDPDLKESVELIAQDTERGEKDAKLGKIVAKELFTAGCLAIYDGIARGEEFHLETIAKFYRNLDFHTAFELQRSISLTLLRQSQPPHDRTKSSLIWCK